MPVAIAKALSSSHRSIVRQNVELTVGGQGPSTAYQTSEGRAGDREQGP